MNHNFLLGGEQMVLDPTHVFVLTTKMSNPPTTIPSHFGQEQLLFPLKRNSMNTYVQNVVSDFLWTTMIYLIIYLFTNFRTPIGINSNRWGCFGFQTCLLHTEIFCGTCGVQGWLGRHRFSHPKTLFFFIIDFSNNYFQTFLLKCELCKNLETINKSPTLNKVVLT